MATFFEPGGDSNPFDDFLARLFSGERPAQRVDITKLMSKQAHELVSAAASEAAQRGHTEVDALHLLWAAAKGGPTRELLGQSGADPDKLATEADQQLPPTVSDATNTADAAEAPPLTSAARAALVNGHQISRAVGSAFIGPEHILLALTANHGSAAGRILLAAEVTPESLQSGASGTQASSDKPGEQTNTPTLDQYGHDLTATARAGELDPVIGREQEIEQTIEVLARRTKNNPVLIGEAGVGKTAIVEGIAQRVSDDTVPEVLSGKRIIALDISGMLAGTRYRGDFEERMNKVISEISDHRDEIIVFIDEIHTVVGAGGAEGAVDASNMLKPRLARGELHVVGATTLEEYRKNIEKDAALERRFQPVVVDEPSTADALAIISGLRENYETHHKVRFTDAALEAAVELSDRYLSDRFLPDKAIDLIDQAGARTRLRASNPSSELRELRKQAERLEQDKDQAVADENYERASSLRDEITGVQERIAAMSGSAESESTEVTANEIAEVVSRATGIPASQLTEQEKSRLARLEDELHERVVGQDDAVHAIARSIRRSRAGMGDPQRPVGSFLFLGPTGVGKTELARALAGSLFGDSEHMLRLDMSEYQEAHTASRLIGAPPGYVGHGEAGQLTEPVRRRPYTVVLLDEVEKAHPDVFNTLLQVLDDGRLTDGQGRTVDFNNTVLIMTSNLGSDIISSGSGTIGFSSATQDGTDKPVRERLLSRLRESFRPEFLNRVDEVVIFRKLDTEQLRSITDLLLEESRDRLRAQDIGIEFSAETIDWLAQRGHQPEFGARPLRRTIQRDVDDQLADLLLDNNLVSGQHVRVDTNGDELTFQVTGTPATADAA